MKKIIILFIVFLVLSSFIGCNKKENNKIIDDTEKNIVKEDKKLDAGYFGQWEIAKNIAYSRVYAMTEKDINKMIGKKITLSEQSANIYGDIVSNPTYIQEFISEDFTWGLGNVTFYQLGISENSILSVKINYNKQHFSFLVKDQNTLITYCDGVFFELKRIGEVSNHAKIIENQSFLHDFENLGKLRFTSTQINDSNNLPKLKLFLINESREILYEFPDFYGNQWSALWEVRAVTFNDVDNDELSDILIIADYMTGVGENGAKPFSVCGLYFQKDKKFINDISLDEELNSKIKDIRISSILEYLKKKYPNKETSNIIFDSLNGTWEGIDNSENYGTTLEIKNYTNEGFDFDIEAFLVVNTSNVRTGSIIGNAYLKENKFEFKTDDENLTGSFSVADDKLVIEYVGDTAYYGGLGVQFGTEFKRIDN